MDYPPPRLVFCGTTAGCNLRCIPCCRVALADELTPQDLSMEEAYQLIDESRATGCPIFVLSGFRPDIYNVVDYASGVKRVSISFDGADAATHDMFRGLSDSFNMAVKGFKALRNVGLPVQVNTTIASHNKAHLEALLQLAKDLDAVGLHLFLLVPMGCGVEIAEDQMINAQEYEQVLNDIKQPEPDLQLKATCTPHYFRVMRTCHAEEHCKGGKHEPPASHDRQVNGHPHGQMHAATEGCLAGTGVTFVSHREVYAVVEDRDAGWAKIRQFRAGLQNILLDELQPCLYQLDDTAAINHLMQVACGLDAMIIGQVTQALEDAPTAGLLGPMVSHLSFMHHRNAIQNRSNGRLIVFSMRWVVSLHMPEQKVSGVSDNVGLAAQRGNLTCTNYRIHKPFTIKRADADVGPTYFAKDVK